jgi:hypothetical protein
VRQIKRVSAYVRGQPGHHPHLAISEASFRTSKPAELPL